MSYIQQVFGTELPLYDIMLRLLMASVCGALIGWNRETHDKPAGLRTYMLVSIGSASFLLLAIELTGSHNLNPSELARVLAGILTGVGFLGAGTIIHQTPGSVHGVTTAAGIWLVSGIGAMCGSGKFALALVSTFFGLLVLVVINRIKHKFPTHPENIENLHRNMKL